MTAIIEKELSYAVNGCVFDVHNEVGPGLREECYQKALESALASRGIPFQAKPQTQRSLVHRNADVDLFEPDLVVAEELIVELKANREGLAPAHYTQLLNVCKTRFEIRGVRP